MIDVIDVITAELKLDRQKVEGVVALLKEEYSVPFIAHYRKEKIGGLNETQIHAIRDRFRALSEVEARRAQAIKTITETGKLTPELQAKIEGAPNRAELEDWYMAYRSRRRTRSAAAKAKGLEPLAELIWKQESSTGSVEEIVKPFISAEKEVKDMAEALSGARDIIAERVAEHPETRKIVRDLLVAEGKVTAKAREGVDLAKGKFSGYANFSEPLTKIPAHRILAVMRGSSEKQLSVVIEAPKEQTLAKVKELLITNQDAALKPELVLAIEEAYDRLLAPSMDNELRLELKHRADMEAIEVFAKNLRALLLQAPFGNKPVLAIDPGLRNGCKLAVLDGDGKVVAHTTIHPHRRQKDEKPAPKVEAPAATAETPAATETTNKERDKPAEAPATEAPAAAAPTETTSAVPAEASAAASNQGKGHEIDAEARKQASEKLASLIKEHGIKAVAIGNGTGSRETDLFVRDVLKDAGANDVLRIVVNESGASIYSASPVAREELPDVDAPTRNAVFIGRRLQNPLAELVKLDPKAIGVGQYQHDVDQSLLKQKLDDVVESCVNQVGVDVNTASMALLRFVSGLNPTLAKNIIDARTAKGGFKSREELKAVTDVGAKHYEQSAGFLRVRNGENPLDATAVHPDSYATVEKMAAAAGTSTKDLLGNADAIAKLQLDQFKSDTAGDATLQDIAAELKSPGRDPREQFVMPEFNEDVRDVHDLKDGMVLNGVVTNLTAFGAFVDIGVHQDGLVHISAITHKFIRDPSEVLAVGQRVKVKVLSVEKDRKRISLSMKALQEQPQQRRPAPRGRATTGEGAAGALTPGAGGARPPRGPGGPRGDRPRGPRPPRQAGAGQPNSSLPGAQPLPGAEPAGAGAPAAGAAPFNRGGRPERGDRRNAGSSGPNRGGGDKGGRRDDNRRGPPAPKPVEPGKPDYSKFFVKSKRKEKERRPIDTSAASRDEVRQLLRSQDSGGTTLGDLLKKAGVVTDDNAN